MELSLSRKNVRRLIMGKEAAEEKTEKAIADLERKCTFSLFWFMALIGAYSVC